MSSKELNEVLEKALAEINEYCLSVHSKVVFLGHVEEPELLIYPHITVIDPLGISVNIGMMVKGQTQAVEILAKYGIAGAYVRDRDTNSIQFIGIYNKGAQND